MGRDKGGASVLAVIWVAVLVTVALAAAMLVSAWHARVRVAGAADLAALAAASSILEQPERSCRMAEEVASRNAAVLSDCRIQGVDVWVQTSVVWSGPGPGGIRGLALLLQARAHATITEQG